MRPISVFVLACSFCVLVMPARAAVVAESARDIPVAYDVDVVVVGGSTGAVAAAVEAAKDGARVFLAAPRPYLGEDLCATYRYWLEPGEEAASPLAKALFTPPEPPFDLKSAVAFTYEASRPSANAHKDTDPPGKLCDGTATDAPSQSVQYDGDVDLVLTVKAPAELAKVHVLAYQRKKDFDVAQVTVSGSDDKQAWRELATVENPDLDKGNFENAPMDLAAKITGAPKYIKVSCKKSAAAHRILLGEIVLVPVEAPGASVPTSPSPTTPMQVKRTLDQALLDAGVSFLYGCYATDVLRDSAGTPAGIVMANRAGRQAVKAKVIVDATARATVARLAGAECAPYPAGGQAFLRTVVGGEPMAGLHARMLPSPVRLDPDKILGEQYKAFEYELDIPMNDASFASFAEAEQRARDATWSPKLVDASETLFQVPPDPIKGKRAATDFAGADQLDLDALRPAKMPRLFVLGACADLPREAAARMVRPVALLEVGRRVGEAAAAEAKSAPAGDVGKQPGAPADDAVAGDVKEVLNGTRPIQAGLPTIHFEGRSVPVLGSYDVVVVGGGTGGAPAGVAAARQGAKTLVIEYLDGLGGVGTQGLIGTYYYGYRGGFTEEIDKGVAALGGTEKPATPSWNVQWKMEWFRRELRKAGADTWFGALACGALVDGNAIKGVVVATPAGRGVVLAKTVIDGTGNADVAYAAGAECMTTGAANIAMQGTGMPPRDPRAHYTNTDYTFTDDADIVDAWRTFVAGREKYKTAYDMGQLVDTRERRRIVGECVVSPLDIWNHRTYPDTIGIAKSNFDTHGFTVHALFALQLPGKDEVTAHTPYRALLPKRLDDILVIGLGVSAHRDAMPILRMQPDIQNQGYAAGIAAAMAAKANVRPRDINVKALQRQLAEIQAVPASVLTDKDSYPFSREQVKAAVARLVPDYDGAAVILAQPRDALPVLRDAFQSADSDGARLIYAHVLAMLGDDAGAALLAKTVASVSWDEGWSFTGSGQFGASLSRLDSLVVALARTHWFGALPAIVEKAGMLDAKSAFSHHRAVAIALETLGQPQAAPALATLLAKDAMTGYACTDIEKAKAAAQLASPNLDRDRSLRELILARALYRCGDQDGLAKTILEQYAQDLRGHLAQHANAVLKGDGGAKGEGTDIEGVK